MSVRRADRSRSGPARERGKGDSEAGSAVPGVLRLGSHMLRVPRCGSSEVQGSWLVRYMDAIRFMISRLTFLDIPTADSAYPKFARADLGDCEAVL